MKQIYFLFITTLISISSFAQNAEDTTDGRFHDDLLNHLAGNWDVATIAHGSPFTANLEADWVLNHQYLHIHFKSHEVIPWLYMQMEYEEFFGYNHSKKHYVVHEMIVFGDENPDEGFCYAYRTGNEIKTVQKYSSDSLIVQRLTWEPASGSWNIKSRWVIAGKEGEIFLDMKLVAAKSSDSKKSLSK